MKTLKSYDKYFESNTNIFDGVTVIDRINSDLTELPELPNTLKTLYCFNNNLTELPELPDTLEELDCSNNNLIKLPELPDTLEELDCSGNNLPYNDLEEYKIWHKWKYPWKYSAKNFNI